MPSHELVVGVWQRASSVAGVWLGLGLLQWRVVGHHVHDQVRSVNAVVFAGGLGFIMTHLRRFVRYKLDTGFYVFVYETNGVNVAHGANPRYVPWFAWCNAVIFNKRVNSLSLSAAS